MPRVRAEGRAELVGLYVFRDGEALEKVQRELLVLRRLPLKKPKKV